MEGAVDLQPEEDEVDYEMADGEGLETEKTAEDVLVETDEKPEEDEKPEGDEKAQEAEVDEDAELQVEEVPAEATPELKPAPKKEPPAKVFDVEWSAETVDDTRPKLTVAIVLN